MAWGRSGLAATAVVAYALAAGVANAHPFAHWTGTAGPFRWEADTVRCGAVTGQWNRIEAHSRWINSPDNGYQRAVFRRQLWNPDAEAWETVSSRTRSTKNTLEGQEFVLHWTQTFQPASGEAGRTMRNIVRFSWRRDRSGPDRTVFTRRVVLDSCVVGA